MLKKVSIISAILLTGCASPKIATIQKPVMSPPPPCEMVVAGKCKTMTAQEKSGATSLGYKDDEDLPAKASQP